MESFRVVGVNDGNGPTGRSNKASKGEQKRLRCQIFDQVEVDGTSSSTGEDQEPNFLLQPDVFSSSIGWTRTRNKERTCVINARYLKWKLLTDTISRQGRSLFTEGPRVALTANNT